MTFFLNVLISVRKYWFFAVVSLLVDVLVTNIMTATLTVAKYIPPESDEVQIAFSGIDMPLGRFLLCHHQSEYCAIKFTDFRKDDTLGEKFAIYTAYCRSDGKRDFLEAGTKILKAEASLLRPRGPFYPLIWQPGNPVIKCGSLELLWCPRGLVCFFERSKSPGDYGIELAPTPWQDISKVNLLDTRIRWYRYDANRQNVNVPIDNLWSEPKVGR